MSKPSDESLRGIDAQVAEATQRIVTERIVAEQAALQAQEEAEKRVELEQKLADEQELVKELVLRNAASFAIYLNSKEVKPTIFLGAPSYVSEYDIERVSRWLPPVKSLKSVRLSNTQGWSVEKTVEEVNVVTGGGSMRGEEYSVSKQITGIALTDNGGLYNYEVVKGGILRPSPVLGEQIIPLNLLDFDDANKSAQNAAIATWHGKFVELAASLLASQQD